MELARLAREHDLAQSRRVRNCFSRVGRAAGSATRGWRGSRTCAAASERPARAERQVFDGLVEDRAGARLEAETRATPTARLRSHRRSVGDSRTQVEHRCVRSRTASRCAAKSCSKRDPANPAPAEEAFQTAIAIAKEQGARSFELRAALSLAKLYQSTGRPAEAHAVLAPALEGFSPTPEMPEIAEAQALLVAIEAGAHVRHE